MKLRNLFFAAFGLFALAACNDTPESPYNPGGDTPGGNGGNTTNGFAYIDETFEKSLGAFTTQQEVGNFAWKHEVYNEKAYAKVSGFANGASQEAISWMISPSFNLSKETKAYVSFEYVINKGETSAAATNHKLMVTSEYTGDATTTEWTEVDFGAVNNNSWNFQKTGNVNLPIDFIGAENVVIAFKYISSKETSSTWEVKNVLVTGEVGATEEYNPVVNKPSIDGENLLENSDFEVWENNKPLGWGMTVTNGTYSQSSDANSGTASVLIEGNASSNKRLASKSYTLKAGTYTLAAYFKSTGDAAGQFRLGYAKLTDGVVADTQNDYIYITSAAQVPSAWGLSYESFTLETETEIAIIIMNSKYGSGASILVDDVTLTTTDGGIVEDTGSEEPETPAGAYISEAFTNGFGSFTTQETIGNYAWVSDAQYGAKASGYADGKSQNAESWLISPAIDFTNETAAYIAFDYVINKGDASAAAANHKLVITSNYTGDVATTEWTEVNYGAVNNGSWTFQNTGKIALPASMMGQAEVVFAFKYMSTTANSSTWEIKNVVVSSGTGATPETPETPEPEEPETPDTPDTPTAEAGVFDFTNPEALTPSVERAIVEAGSTQGAGVEASEYTFTNGNVTVKVAQGSATTPVRFWTRTGGDVELRTYKNSTITVSVSEGTMSSIVFEGGKVNDMSADTGSFSAGTWSGDAQSVTFSVSKTLNIQKLTVK